MAPTMARLSLSNLSGKSAVRQVQALQLRFSRETLNIVNNLGLTSTQMAKLMKLLNDAISDSVHKELVSHSMTLFHFENLQTCNICSNDCLQKALRDQVIEGLRDGDIQELLQVKDLTLDQAITKC